MKILLLSNIVLPDICKLHNLEINNGGGWIVSTVNALKETHELVLCCYGGNSERYEGRIDGYKYHVFSNNSSRVHYFEEILKTESPDCIHIFGTEYPHSYDMVLACEAVGLLEKTIVSIQGLSSVYAKHFFGGLPNRVKYFFSIRDLLRKDNVFLKQRGFIKKGNKEIELLKKVKYVIGRTDWDYACTHFINPQLIYLKCNETLRESFYSDEWNYEQCEKHRIFVSQCNYSIKGFHYILEAVRIIREFYPDVVVATTGSNNTSLKSKLKRTYYRMYLDQQIKKYNLESSIEFLGSLSEQEMKEEYLKCNVFASGSLIENSPNSVGEAMLLSVPVVSSNVGGVPNLLENFKEGYLYQVDAPYMMAYYILEIFNNPDKAVVLGKNARKHAQITHDPQLNFERLVEIYAQIGNSK